MTKYDLGKPINVQGLGADLRRSLIVATSISIGTDLWNRMRGGLRGGLRDSLRDGLLGNLRTRQEEK